MNQYIIVYGCYHSKNYNIRYIKETDLSQGGIENERVKLTKGILPNHLNKEVKKHITSQNRE